MAAPSPAPDRSAAPPCGLYLVTPPRLDDPAAFAGTLAAALDAGDVACLQVRLKDATGGGRNGADDAETDDHADDAVRRAADALLPVARSRGVAVIINDRPDLAAELHADGVHLGQNDMACAEARKIVGRDAIIGVTCHDSRHLAMVAGEAGADYVAFGAFFSSGTKRAASRAMPEILTWWQQLFEIPCVAIGGITPANAAPLIRAGADFLAVSAGVWDHPGGPAAAVSAFSRLIAATPRAGPEQWQANRGPADQV